MKFYGGRNFATRTDRFENRSKHLPDRGEGGVASFTRIEQWNSIFLDPLTSAFPRWKRILISFQLDGRKSNLVIRHPRDVSLIARKVSLIVSYPLN